MSGWCEPPPDGILQSAGLVSLSCFSGAFSKSDCCSALGTQALLEAVVHYDQFRIEAEGQK